MNHANGGGEDHNARRLDEMQKVIHSMIDLVHAQSAVWSKQHEEIMAEIRESRAEIRESRAEIRESRAEIQDLIILQKEHRIDIMALFELNKDTKRRLKSLEEEGSKS